MALSEVKLDLPTGQGIRPLFRGSEERALWFPLPVSKSYNFTIRNATE